jgi:hypothetical protein
MAATPFTAWLECTLKVWFTAGTITECYRHFRRAKNQNGSDAQGEACAR